MIVCYYYAGQESGSKDLAVRGPLARNASDLQLALDVLSETKCSNPVPGQLSAFTVAVLADDKACPVGRDVAFAIEQCIECLEQSGAAVLVGPSELPAQAETFSMYMKLLGAKGASSDAGRHAALVEQAQAVGSELIDYFVGRAMTHGEWAAVHGSRLRMEDKIERFFRKYDVLVMPNAPCGAIESDEVAGLDAYGAGREIVIDGVPRPYTDLFFWPHLATLCGVPSVAFPICQSDGGLPIGIQVLGPKNADELVIHFAGLVARALDVDETPFAKIRTK